jgi:hypothetical protein
MGMVLSRLRIEGSALVARFNQVSVLPEDAARLNAPRMMKRSNKGRKKAFGPLPESD